MLFPFILLANRDDGINVLLIHPYPLYPVTNKINAYFLKSGNVILLVTPEAVRTDVILTSLMLEILEFSSLYVI